MLNSNVLSSTICLSATYYSSYCSVVCPYPKMTNKLNLQASLFLSNRNRGGEGVGGASTRSGESTRWGSYGDVVGETSQLRLECVGSYPPFDPKKKKKKSKVWCCSIKHICGKIIKLNLSVPDNKTISVEIYL